MQQCLNRALGVVGVAVLTLNLACAESPSLPVRENGAASPVEISVQVAPGETTLVTIECSNDTCPPDADITVVLDEDGVAEVTTATGEGAIYVWVAGLASGQAQVTIQTSRPPPVITRRILVAVVEQRVTVDIPDDISLPSGLTIISSQDSSSVDEEVFFPRPSLDAEAGLGEAGVMIVGESGVPILMAVANQHDPTSLSVESTVHYLATILLSLREEFGEETPAPSMASLSSLPSWEMAVARFEEALRADVTNPLESHLGPSALGGVFQLTSEYLAGLDLQTVRSQTSVDVPRVLGFFSDKPDEDPCFTGIVTAWNDTEVWFTLSATWPGQSEPYESVLPAVQEDFSRFFRADTVLGRTDHFWPTGKEISVRLEPFEEALLLALAYKVLRVANATASMNKAVKSLGSSELKPFLVTLASQVLSLGNTSKLSEALDRYRLSGDPLPSMRLLADHMVEHPEFYAKFASQIGLKAGSNYILTRMGVLGRLIIAALATDSAVSSAFSWRAFFADIGDYSYGRDELVWQYGNTVIQPSDHAAVTLVVTDGMGGAAKLAWVSDVGLCDLFGGHLGVTDADGVLELPVTPLGGRDITLKIGGAFGEVTRELLVPISFSDLEPGGVLRLAFDFPLVEIYLETRAIAGERVDSVQTLQGGNQSHSIVSNSASLVCGGDQDRAQARSTVFSEVVGDTVRGTWTANNLVTSHGFRSVAVAIGSVSITLPSTGTWTASFGGNVSEQQSSCYHRLSGSFESYAGGTGTEGPILRQSYGYWEMYGSEANLFEENCSGSASCTGTYRVTWQFVRNSD